MTYLNQPTVIPCNKQFSIVTNEATSRNIFESCDRLCYFLCPRGIYVHSRSCSDRISMWFRLCKMNRSNGSIFLDENGAFEGPPISGFYAMFFWSRFCMFTWDDRLVLHTAVTHGLCASQITFSRSRVPVGADECADRSIFTPLLHFLSLVFRAPLKYAAVPGYYDRR